MLLLRYGYVISAPFCRHSDPGSCHRWDPLFADIFPSDESTYFSVFLPHGRLLEQWLILPLWICLLLMWSSLVTPAVILSIFISVAVSLLLHFVHGPTFGRVQECGPDECCVQLAFQFPWHFLVAENARVFSPLHPPYTGAIFDVIIAGSFASNIWGI